MTRRRSPSHREVPDSVSTLPPADGTGPTVPPVLSVCRLRIPLPNSAWIAGFSRDHPEIRIEVLSRLDLGPRTSLTELQLHVPSPGPWVEEIRALPQVREVEPLGESSSSVHLRAIHRTSQFIPLFRRFHLMRRFPFTIQGGEAIWIVRASERTVRSLLLALQDSAPGATIQSVTHPSARSSGESVLTARQEEVFRRAMAAGYFDVPRRISLTALARQMDLAASSLSESLAKIEKKLLEHLPEAVFSSTE